MADLSEGGDEAIALGHKDVQTNMGAFSWGRTWAETRGMHGAARLGSR